jgi:putative MATE family efflux protein
MLDRKTLKTYLRYIVPSTLAFVLTGIYSVVDGLFVGQTVGDAGLAGVNVAWPLVAFVMATGTGVGMGGAVISSIRYGERDLQGANRAVGHTLTLLVVVTVPIMAMLLLFGQPLIQLIGGRDEVLEQAQMYISIMAWGALFQVIAAGSLPLIRNKGKVAFAFAAVTISGLINIGLDYLTVILWGWGVRGAALATVASQAFVFALVIWFFTRKGNRLRRVDFGFDRALAARTFKIGFAPAALTLLPEVTTVVINIASEAWGGVSAQAAFAVISYTAVAVQWVIQGVNDGSQPLISRCYGAGDMPTMRALRRTNYLVDVALGIAGTVLLIGLRVQLARWFGVSDEASQVFYHGIVLFSLMFVFYAIAHATTSYFYAVEGSRIASVLVVGEAVLMVVYAQILPLAIGIDGVWLTVVACQATLAACAVVLLHRNAARIAQRTQRQEAKREQREEQVDAV